MPVTDLIEQLKRLPAYADVLIEKEVQDDCVTLSEFEVKPGDDFPGVESMIVILRSPRTETWKECNQHG